MNKVGRNGAQDLLEILDVEVQNFIEVKGESLIIRGWGGEIVIDCSTIGGGTWFFNDTAD